MTTIIDSDALATLVRDMYLAYYRRVTGSNRYSAKYWPAHVWPAITRRIIGLDAAPRTYLELQSSCYSKQGVLPPQMCASDWAAANWQTVSQANEDRIRRQLQVDRNSLKVSAMPMIVSLGWSQEEAVVYCVQAPATNISSLYRYCQAEALGLLAAAARWRGPALIGQYVWQQPIYDRHWGDIIPTSLRDAATTLRQAVGQPVPVAGKWSS